MLGLELYEIQWSVALSQVTGLHYRLLGGEQFRSTSAKSACRLTVSQETPLPKTIKGHFGRWAILKACPGNAVSSSEQLSAVYHTRSDKAESTPPLSRAEKEAQMTAFHRATGPEQQKTLQTATPGCADKQLVRTRGAQHLQIHKEFVKNWEPVSHSEKFKKRGNSTCKQHVQTEPNTPLPMAPGTGGKRHDRTSHLFPQSLGSGTAKGHQVSRKSKLLRKLQLISFKCIEVA